MPKLTIYVPEIDADLPRRLKSAGLNVSAICVAALKAAVADHVEPPPTLVAKVFELEERIAEVERRTFGRALR